MKILGFNFEKIGVEKFNNKEGELKITTKIDVTDVKKVNPGFLNIKEDILGVNFSYLINYEPKYAKIEFTGKLLVSVDQKVSKEALKQWKDKKVPEDLNIFVLNVVLRKSNIKALQLEDDLNLPLHMPMQRIGKQ